MYGMPICSVEPQQVVPSSYLWDPFGNVFQTLMMRVIVVSHSISSIISSQMAHSSSNITSSQIPFFVTGTLSTRTKIGIGTGAGLKVLVLISTILTIVFLLQRLRRQRTRKVESDSEGSSKDKPVLPGCSIFEANEGRAIAAMNDAGLTEMDGQAVVEVEGCGAAEMTEGYSLYEMADTSLPVEASGSDVEFRVI
ncbi:hypothetical protein P280DRAFT_475662 [Massarina eburnea CBS 473.64]|uniref:Uncharacterized protein n=1 Tax=Massarina eburnea CBS 473.64 TaxID=1395130 RepID=A0A6A6SGB8_9PLEO|nr:hypothetical protein P280DRAFT_475662 [Massarina eburnea CBS 473.64]